MNNTVKGMNNTVLEYRQNHVRLSIDACNRWIENEMMEGLCALQVRYNRQTRMLSG
jgi:hypothetical protein